ncbi:MAG: VWA domain-containing protein [Planctomycetes bacterium]|nr:VWA domain-containing protein [Planctomycetota bacterium]
MKSKFLILAMGVLMAAGLLLNVIDKLKADEPVPIGKNKPQDQSRTQPIDLAICLDTSNSMDGLIESAKQKLWAIVNDLATAKPRPKLRVALYQYGNDSLKADTGWIQQVSPFTDDLDGIYEKLFKLRTQGGTEYVAGVTRAASEDLEWSQEKNALKMIVVAGNEPATQDPKNKLEDTCKAIVSKGIIINTIFCGNMEEGRGSGWADAARWADGQYASIDQNSGTIAVATPMDQKLVDLSGELNKTYIAYGRDKAELEQAGKAQENQAMQDSNAKSAGAPAAAQRAAAKSTVLYDNAKWDLVDASKKNKDAAADVPADALPENMKKMTVEERKAYVAEQGKKREEIQKQIKDLSTQREAYVKAEMEKKGLDESKGFDAALRKMIRQQAKAKGFEFEQPTTRPAVEK